MASSIPTSFLSSAKTWNWQGFNICYQNQGITGPSILMVHGFGASWKHWRKNIPVLAKNSRVYAIDLLGFGASDKPQPGNKLNYTFDTWGQQITDFCREVIRVPVFLVGNSIGCIVAMQAAVNNPDLVLGVALINCSLRLMHDHKRKDLPLFWRIGTPLLQKFLTFKPLGKFFFKKIANPSTIRNILFQAYIHREAVTDELVEIIASPAREYGAADVFIAFTGYSSGPLAEDLLPQLKCPAIILWGSADPWEPIHLGRKLAEFAQVKKFISLDGVGHCPQDEVPELVNPILQDWVQGS
ncbi:Possible alpha/beta hydrolase superfamily,slr1917 homolog [Richelia intracellularis HH01]|uniref:Possible alpha/beta hydrolase superfamily,slr1917 homolog n=1 Tax=Richelia intracellularis HH01 TaxID=1165094 RepID=M1X2V8_9NOST|nr:alpha/beta fold hydrolase [Richelia intracellularis]CCH67500.1 Possible alpha/beta hydrolase superfamily,slr1917 homolog [Richelia intracellularis HH01]HAE06263.1 alpha/beta hydrolase [Richelia sp.]